MAKSAKASALQGEVSEAQTNGIVHEVTTAEQVSSVFDRTAFEAMQNDEDLSPSLADEGEDSYIPLSRPGKSYFTICPDKAYELVWTFTYDFRKSAAKNDPYLVLRPYWSKFPPSLIRIKRLLLCQTFQDETLRYFLWLADWHESSESPNELHKSIARTIVKGRQGWGQALFDNQSGIYVWRRWPESRLGQLPEPFWPVDRDMFDIVQETFQDRIIATPDHELIQSIGEE